MKQVKVENLHDTALAWVLLVYEDMQNGATEEEAEMDAKDVRIGFFDLEDLMERYRVGIMPPDGHRGSQWVAFFCQRTQHDLTFAEGIQGAQFGGTPITAVMRAIIAEYVGKVVNVPDELAED